MNVLVTGGTGFIGSHLATALVQRGDRVRVLRRASSSLIALDGLPVEHSIGDILDPDAVARAVSGCDLVFHVAALASYWRARREQVYRINVDGTRVVMQACLRAGVPRVVYTSSVAAIGITSDRAPAHEETPFDPLSKTFVYADSKHRAEAEVQRSVAQGLSAVIVNPAAVIGSVDHHLISSSMVVEFARRYVPLVSPGGMAVADVDAVVQGHLAAAERGRSGERYILGGENLSHWDTIETVVEVVGGRRPLVTVPRFLMVAIAPLVDGFNAVWPGPPRFSGKQARLSTVDMVFDCRRAHEELGLPLTPFRVAVERAYAWYAERGYL